MEGKARKDEKEKLIQTRRKGKEENKGNTEENKSKICRVERNKKKGGMK